MSWNVWRLTGLFAAGVVLTACGGGGGPSTQIKVTMTDFAFTPNAFSVPAGEEITFKATNTGAVAHNFVIMAQGHEVSGHFQPEDKPNVFWEEGEVPPGASVEATFSAPPDPGVYQIVCSTAGHLEAGMVGKLTVVAQP